MKGKLLLALLLLTVLSAEAEEKPVLTAINVLDNAVQIKASGAFKYKVSQPMGKPYRVTVELSGVGIGGIANRLASDKKGISEVTVEKPMSPTADLVIGISLKSQMDVEETYKDNTLTITAKEKEMFIYDPAGRRDPFLSIIMATESERAQRLKERPTHPLEGYDIIQFKLIAIVVEKTQKHALIGLPDGKYYTAREGMTTGLYGGKVIRITPDTVVIREMIKDYTGKVVPKDSTIKLRKEGRE